MVGRGSLLPSIAGAGTTTGKHWQAKARTSSHPNGRSAHQCAQSNGCSSGRGRRAGCSPPGRAAGCTRGRGDAGREGDVSVSSHVLPVPAVGPYKKSRFITGRQADGDLWLTEEAPAGHPASGRWSEGRSRDLTQPVRCRLSGHAPSCPRSSKPGPARTLHRCGRGRRPPRPAPPCPTAAACAECRLPAGRRAPARCRSAACLRQGQRGSKIELELARPPSTHDSS